MQPAKEQVEACEQQDGPVAVLEGGGGHADAEDHAEGVHGQVSLASADLLACIVADRLAALLGAFDALAVEDGRGRRWLAACGDAHLDPQALVELFPQAAFAPGAEVLEDGGLGRKVLGQHAPLTAGAVEIEDGVEDVSAWVLNRSPGGFGPGKERLKKLPFKIGEVAGIGLGWVHPKLEGWKL